MKSKKVVIYDIEYLKSGDYSDDDLFLLFESNSLLYSLISAQFDIIDNHKSKDEITAITKNITSWPDNYFFNYSQYNEFITNLTKIFKNLYQYGDETCLQMSQYWMICYGFRKRQK